MRNPLQIPLLLLVMLPLNAGCTKSPQIVDQADWPSPMADLLESYPEISTTITTYQHDAFIDSKFVWKITGKNHEIDKLIRDLELQPATTDHTKFKELKRSIPRTWRLPKSGSTLVYASKGYGIEHQEGVNLLLLVRNTTENETIVLYEWIF